MRISSLSGPDRQISSWRNHFNVSLFGRPANQRDPKDISTIYAKELLICILFK